MGRVLSFPHPGSRHCVNEISRYFDSKTSVHKCPPSNTDMETASRASAAGLGCVRGTALMLAFEAATGLTIYAIWLAVVLFHS